MHLSPRTIHPPYIGSAILTESVIQANKCNYAKYVTCISVCTYICGTDRYIDTYTVIFEFWKLMLYSGLYSNC